MSRLFINIPVFINFPQFRENTDQEYLRLSAMAVKWIVRVDLILLLTSKKAYDSTYSVDWLNEIVNTSLQEAQAYEVFKLHNDRQKQLERLSRSHNHSKNIRIRLQS